MKNRRKVATIIVLILAWMGSCWWFAYLVVKNIDVNAGAGAYPGEPDYILQEFLKVPLCLLPIVVIVLLAIEWAGRRAKHDRA